MRSRQLLQSHHHHYTQPISCNLSIKTRADPDTRFATTFPFLTRTLLLLLLIALLFVPLANGEAIDVPGLAKSFSQTNSDPAVTNLEVQLSGALEEMRDGGNVEAQMQKNSGGFEVSRLSRSCMPLE